ncbi:MAG: penicillin acylase family protein, partial [Psychroserpens sp.]|nr:penicillin acylase family protein [Psychroserpens sp.]
GTLGIIIGFNEDIAWGVTNATRDVMDWYKVEFQDSSRTSYKYNIYTNSLVGIVFH